MAGQAVAVAAGGIHFVPCCFPLMDCTIVACAVAGVAAAEIGDLDETAVAAAWVQNTAGPVDTWSPLVASAWVAVAVQRDGTRAAGRPAAVQGTGPGVPAMAVESKASAVVAEDLPSSDSFPSRQQNARSSNGRRGNSLNS